MSRIGERTVVVVGTLPLMAAAVWLLCLRTPKPAAAFAARHGTDAAGAVIEGVRTAGPHCLGVVVAGQDADLAAELSGEVLRIFASPGTRLRRGDPILQLTAASMHGAKGMATAQAAEDRSAIEASRLNVEDLRDKIARMQAAASAYPQREIEHARAELSRASADLERLRASAALHRANFGRELARADRLWLRAPFDGVLAALAIDVGDFVSPGQTLARVVDDARFVRFATSADEHARLQLGDAVQVFVKAEPAPLSAAVVEITPELDAAAGVGFARARLALDPARALALQPGTRSEVLLGAAPSSTAVPRSQP